MSDIPKDLVAVSAKAGVFCAECVGEDPSYLELPGATVVLSTDNWKHEVMEEKCESCGFRIGEIAGE